MLFLFLLVALYFLPTFIAAHRGHPVGGIFLLNLLFGWTVIGWFAMVLFALVAFPRYRFYTPLVAPGARYAAWERF
jgi:hypothetical protein